MCFLHLKDFRLFPVALLKPSAQVWTFGPTAALGFPNFFAFSVKD